MRSKSGIFILGDRLKYSQYAERGDRFLIGESNTIQNAIAPILSLVT